MPLSLGNVRALQTFPTQTEITDYSKAQTFIITVFNDGPKTEDVTMSIDPYSFYLKDHIKVEPESFRLAPNSRRNVELTSSLPSSLSPETHHFRIMPVTKDQKGGVADFTFTVPGEARHDLSVSQVKAGDIMQDEPIIIDIFLNNKGNVIAWATPHITIHNASGIVAEIESESIIQIMPRSSYNLTFRHELFEPGPGVYRIAVRFDYDGGKLSTEEKAAAFSIKETAEEHKEVPWIIWPVAGLAAFLAVIFAVWAGRREPSKARRIRALMKRIERLEKETSRMVLETDAFVRRSNHWLNERFGEGNYEFR